MRFSKLDKRHKDILIDQFRTYIEQCANEEGIEDYQEPTLEEYEEFFDNFDVDYKIVDDFPESTIDAENHPTYSIKFVNGKVILNVHERNND